MVILSISFSDQVNITDNQVQVFAEIVRTKVEALETGIEINQDPFSVSLQLEYVFYTEEDMIESIIKSFEEINIVEGEFGITLTECEEDDVDLEAPAYFEEEIDIAKYYEKQRYVTLNIEFRKSKSLMVDGYIIDLSFSDIEIEALSKELNLITENPIFYFGEVLNTNKKLLRLSYEPQPAENIFEKNILKERVLKAIQKSNIICEYFEIGAYIKDWDHTLWLENIVL